jgi:hypothetical protein
MQGKIIAERQAINLLKIWKYLNILNKLRNKIAILGLDIPLINVISVIIKNCIEKDNSGQIKFEKFLLPSFQNILPR